ncbi:hypothetical protein KO507_09750 [Gilvimarinus agarilyticus]|uniref:hypothetical protein n=1 Tax=Reichenbachiella agariperforans TaxID=156994 RepID=UPI001C092442|nr:hypothetical protein [Reichenbachiella agariperforans]MBU2886044.1 hypothetical protein [Gilvimarinus agarilyticus]MBU2913552.1 hypothetical protein [Reichenbachiella agariperforans]
MKQLIYNTFFGLLLTVIVLPVMAKSNVEKKKSVHKVYEVKSFVQLKIENSFGRVHINTTEGQEIDVLVEVIARRKTDERAMELLDRINVDISESGSVIAFKTDIEGNINNRNNEDFEINYTVSMPKVNPLDLKNSFGDAYLANLDGDAKLRISYGNIKAERLNGESDIKVSFGEGDFEYVKTGNIEVKYSEVNFEQLGIVKFEQGFSEVGIGRVKTMELVSKYGQLEIDQVDGIKGYIGYSDLRVGYVGIELDMEAAYVPSFQIEKIAKSFKKVNVQSKFSSIELEFEEGANGSFEAFVKYGDIDYSNALISLNYRNNSDNKAEYRGKIGNGKGGVVTLSNSYGNIEVD